MKTAKGKYGFCKGDLCFASESGSVYYDIDTTDLPYKISEEEDFFNDMKPIFFILKRVKFLWWKFYVSSFSGSEEIPTLKNKAQANKWLLKFLNEEL